MKHIKWPSIEQFRNVVKNVQHRSQYVGKDEEGNPVMDRNAKAPTLTFEGTVKLHGTNAAVGCSESGEIWFQSRERIITIESDNAGFASFATANLEDFKRVFSKFEGKNILIYGEWCGGNIQKGVAICELPKMFVAFGIVEIDGDTSKHLQRDAVEQSLSECKVLKSIYAFPTFSLDIDFDNPHTSQNNLNEITLEVEKECPVAKSFGVSGIGEGVVWRCTNEGYESSSYWFKVKGDEHSKSKVKTLASVDVEKINNLVNLAQVLANAGRLEQMKQQVFDTLNGGEVDIKRTGEFIKAVMSDIIKEENDTIVQNGFTPKELSGHVSKIARDFLMSA